MIGVDVVDVSRLRSALERTPGLEERLFTKAERVYCRSKSRPLEHLAGTLAAKEAVIKALNAGSLAAWASRVEIEREDTGAPHARIDFQGAVRPVAISIAHDGPVAVAVALNAAALLRDRGTAR